MIQFLLCLAFSTEHLFSDLGYYDVNVALNDKITINHTKYSSSSILFWPESPMSSVLVRIQNGTSGAYFDHTIPDESGLQIGSGIATFSIPVQTKIRLWVLPQNLCPDAILMYSTPKYMSDEFTLKKESATICLFYTHTNSTSDFSLEINPKGVGSSAEIYTDANLAHPTQCNSETCATKTKQHFFVRIKGAVAGTSVITQYTLNPVGSSTIPCDRATIPLVDKDNLDVNGLLFRSSIVTCEDSSGSDPVYVHFIILICVFVVAISVIAFLYFCGCCSKLANVIIGAPLRESGQIPQTDPSELLEIHEEEGDIEDGVQEHKESEKKDEAK